MRLAALTLAVATVLVAGGCNRIGGGADAGKAASLDFDKPVSGEITSRSGINYNDGSHHQLYQIKLEDKELVGMKLTGALSGSIAVFNNGTLVSTSNTGYEREGDVSLAFRANGGGTYQVAVNADGPTAFGPYRLRAEKLKPYDGKPLVGSGEIVDMLAGDSQDYTLQVEKEGLYEIRLVSDVFDPVLKLSGHGVDAENDDGGDSTNSRLNLVLKPGKYTLTARGLGDGVNGMFTLSANRIEVPGNLIERDGTALPTSGSAYTMLDNEGSRRFLLTLDRPADVRLDAISGQVDTVLRVVGGDVEDRRRRWQRHQCAPGRNAAGRPLHRRRVQPEQWRGPGGSARAGGWRQRRGRRRLSRACCCRRCGSRGRRCCCGGGGQSLSMIRAMRG